MLTKPNIKSLLVTDRFSTSAKELRSYYDEQFADPTSLDGKRFVWDYWFVKDQYRLLRTPAYHYFPEKMYMRFHKELVMWGRRNLGCWDISPPWLSCYIDGCHQELHSDVPHGPWAFVYSISPKKPQFRGGETLILKEQVLSYWSNYASSDDRELRSLVDLVEPDFNRLVVFDPRLPHGVRRVENVQDPKDGRLVIHGWFSQPKTYIEGTLPAARSEKILNEAFDYVLEALPQDTPLWGTLSLKLQVTPSGKVSKVSFGSMTVKDHLGQIPVDFLKQILMIYKSIQFPKTKGSSLAVVPLIFQ